MLRKIRIFFATLFFLGITLLFLDVTGLLHRYLGWMAHVQLLPAILALHLGIVVVLLLITWIFGRVYCSVICPLGVLQDCFSRLGGFFFKKRFRYTKAHNVLRYIVLTVFVLLLVLGLNGVALLVAPYSMFGRIATVLFRPVYEWGNNLLAMWTASGDSHLFYITEVSSLGVMAWMVAGISLGVLAFLSFRYGRLWCNTICPVGSLLSLLSHYSLFKVVMDADKCKGCHRCEHKCKSMCIDVSSHQIDHSRCVGCMDCLGKCNFDAIHYRFTGMSGRNRADQSGLGAADAPHNSSRRRFLATTAAVGAATVLRAQEQKLDGGLAVIEDKQVPERNMQLKPAGSIGLKHFKQHCTGCQLCVSQCPEKVLRPSSNLDTFMQPYMAFDQGYCRLACTRCGELCPTDAIQSIGKEQKTAISIGHAVVIQDNCIGCGACARHCPSSAIMMVDGMPAVNESRCLGCGACEYYCPARPMTAIYVEGRERHLEI